MVSLVLTIVYPVFMLFRLCKLDKELSHTQPKIERNCKLSFIRENMLLAVVLDSFCMMNYGDLCKKKIVFPRIMGMVTLFF